MQLLSLSQRSILVKQLSVSQLCDFLKYRNDISFHEGEHYCSRSCEGAIFLCGNSYHNFRGDVTKCGHTSYSASGIFHECPGSYDLYFSSRDSRSISAINVSQLH